MMPGETSFLSRSTLWFWGIALVLFIGGVMLLKPILLPFIMGIVFAYLLNPLVDKLSKAKVSRPLAAGLILIVFFGSLALIGFLIYPLIQAQVVDFIRWIPEAVGHAHAYFNEKLLPFLRTYIHEDDLPDLFQKSASHVGTALYFVGQVLNELLLGGAAFVHLIGFLFITPIIAFYLLREWPTIVSAVDEWIPRKNLETVRRVFKDIDTILAGFMRGQLTVCFVLALYYGTVLTLIGVKFGLIVGLIAGTLSFIPFVGFITGFAGSFIIACFQFDTLMPFMLIIGAFTLEQLAENYYLYPQLVGKRVNLHPVWMIFSLFSFGLLLGFMGAVIAIPMAAVIGVLVRFSLDKYLKSPLYLK